MQETQSDLDWLNLHTPLVAAEYVQEAEKHDCDEDQRQRDDSHDGGEHSSCSRCNEEEEDGDTFNETASPIEARSTAVTMASSSPCKSRQSSGMRSSSMQSRWYCINSCI